MIYLSERQANCFKLSSLIWNLILVWPLDRQELFIPREPTYQGANALYRIMQLNLLITAVRKFSCYHSIVRSHHFIIAAHGLEDL